MDVGQVNTTCLLTHQPWALKRLQGAHRQLMARAVTSRWAGR